MSFFHPKAIIAVLAIANGTNAFAPASIPMAGQQHRNQLTRVHIATGIPTSDLVGSTTGGENNNNQNNDPNKNNRKGSMIDLDGIAFSGLKGQALSLTTADFPDTATVRRVIPADCFEPETAKSLGYLSVSVIGTALCTAFGVQALQVLDPANLLTLPFWMAYSAVTGTVAMGLWVLAHECGHGAFSKDKKLQDTVGYILHSLMLVPYYSWQRSHAVHHRYTNHMELGETHVPENSDNGGGKFYDSLELRENILSQFGDEKGMKVWGGLQAFLHLVIGWPAYLLIGATGGPDRGMTNHYYPYPLTEPKQPKKELFPGNWKETVFQSDIGVGVVAAAALTWAACNGPAEMMALYGGPLIVVNAWLVLYTWLQHTDVDVPHFTDADHNFVKGAFHTIDRPYDKLDPWGAIDFLHHKIGSTHVAHHFDSTIPHYKAQVATDAIKENFPEIYLYDPTPIPEALWRVCKGCAAVEKRGEYYIWNNDGLEDKLQ
jgi:omega-6 fatty acid desaturase (delta-12 desaturase)